MFSWCEPQHERCSFGYERSSKDSDHPAHRAVWSEYQKLRWPSEETLESSLSTEFPVMTLIRLLGCAVWSESLLGTHVRSCISHVATTMYYIDIITSLKINFIVPSEMQILLTAIQHQYMNKIVKEHSLSESTVNIVLQKESKRKDQLHIVRHMLNGIFYLSWQFHIKLFANLFMPLFLFVFLLTALNTIYYFSSSGTALY